MGSNGVRAVAAMVCVRVVQHGCDSETRQSNWSMRALRIAEAAGDPSIGVANSLLPLALGMWSSIQNDGRRA